jgi:hypothetical protein
MNSKFPQELFKHWISSDVDKDSNHDVLTFKPVDHNFPPSRGRRRSIDIQKDGNIIFYQMGSDDRPTKTAGSFERDGEDKLKIFFKDDKSTAYFIKILLLDSNNLHIQILKR